MTTWLNKTAIRSKTGETYQQNDGQPLPSTKSNFDITALINAKGELTYADPSILPILGYAPEEVVGCHIAVFVPPDDLDVIQQAFEEFRQSPNRSLHCEVRLRCKDGSWRWFEGRGTNLLSVPTIGAIVANFREMTPHTLAPPSDWSEVSAPKHFVQFYETDEFLLGSLSEFITEGLGADDACIVIATSAHRKSLEQRLKAKGFDLRAAQNQDEYISLDATETLAQFIADGMPSPERFTEVVEGIITRAAKGRHHVRIFGEMVALLWKEGNQAAALRLEALWNDLQDTIHPFSLFCAYPMQGFAGDEYKVQFGTICHQHSEVIPDESYTALTSPDERLRAITLLQQKAHSLQIELAGREAVEERLRISETRYRRLFETSTDGILMVDSETCTISDANSALAELLGYTREQLLGQELWHIGLFSDREATLKVLQGWQDKQVTRYKTLPLQTKDGQHRFVEFVSNRFQASGQETIQCNLRDITDRKQVEEAFRASEKRFRDMTEFIPQVIFTARPSGDIEYLNPQWAHFTGISCEDMSDCDWHQFVHPEDVEGNVEQWQRSMETGEPFYCEHRFRRADGVYRWYISRAIPMRDTEENIMLWIGSSTDIDEQKQMEDRKNAFLCMASHELKTPVTSLKSFTQILQRRLRDQADPQTLLFLDRMDVQLKRLTSLITDLLDVSKMQTGLLTFREASFDFDDLVRETVENLQAATSTHEICVQGEAQAQVYGDRDRLGQVLINLLTNAVKYSPEANTVTVRLSATDKQVELTVQDFGIGIAKEYHERIFEQFYQVSDRQETTYGGLGIGLYIARTLISQHGGHLWLESRLGTGSTFHCSLPLLKN